jgi:hypothetical protein
MKRVCCFNVSHTYPQSCSLMDLQYLDQNARKDTMYNSDTSVPNFIISALKIRSPENLKIPISLPVEDKFIKQWKSTVTAYISERKATETTDLKNSKISMLEFEKFEGWK